MSLRIFTKVGWRSDTNDGLPQLHRRLVVRLDRPSTTPLERIPEGTCHRSGGYTRGRDVWRVKRGRVCYLKKAIQQARKFCAAVGLRDARFGVRVRGWTFSKY